MPGNGPAKRQVELMTCRRAATADGSDGGALAEEAPRRSQSVLERVKMVLASCLGCQIFQGLQLL